MGPGEIDFAALLTALKERDKRSYRALAQRAGISSSALHRYCTGEAVPPTAAVVEQLARAFRASRREHEELQRAWLVSTLRPRPEPDNRTAEAPAPEGPDSPPVPEGEPQPVARPRRRFLLAAGLALASVVAVVAVLVQDGPGAAPPEQPLLLSDECPAVVEMGQTGRCVRELQTLLREIGGNLAIDGEFGPRTRMRVIAVRVLAGFTPEARVDEATKEILYARQVQLRSWPSERIEERIREVFPEEPDRAVGIARCLTLPTFDPFYILANVDGSNNWGVFQLSDARLREFGVTPREAFDPARNIELARRLWERTRDFSHWQHCGQVAPSR